MKKELDPRLLWLVVAAAVVLVGVIGMTYLRSQGLAGGQLDSEKIDPAAYEQSLQDRGGGVPQQPGATTGQAGAPQGFDPNVVRDGRPMDAAQQAAQGGR